MDLVIGGSGFIGCRLTELLLRKGRTVRVFDLNPYPEDEPLYPQEKVVASILDSASLKGAVKGCQNVYHLAGNPHLWDRNPEVFDSANRRGTQNVIEAVRNADINRLVYTSTESILTSRDRKSPITESSVTTYEEMIGPYCRSKFLAERSIKMLADSGFPAVIVNPTMPIGPYDRNLTPPGKLIRNFLLGKIKGYVNCTVNLVDVRDVAKGHLWAAEHAVPGRRHILAGHNMTLKDFFVRLAANCDRPLPRFKVPYPLGLMFSCLEELLGRVSGREPLSSLTGMKLCRRCLAVGGTQTWRVSGGNTVRPLDESITDAVAWHRQEVNRKGYRSEENRA